MVLCLMDSWPAPTWARDTRHHVPDARKSDHSMRRATGGFGHLRVIVGLALTGFAFVVAGRRTHRLDGTIPSPFVSMAGTLQADPAAAVTATDELTDIPLALPAATAGLGDIPALPTTSISGDEAPVGPVADPPVTASGIDGHHGGDSFDMVMSRVSTMLEAATRQCRSLAQIDGSIGTLAVASPVSTTGLDLTTGAVPDDMTAHDYLAVHDDLVAPVGIATKAALFLNEIAPPPAGGPGDDALTGALRGVGLDPALVATVIDAVAAGGGLEMGLVEALATLTVAPAVPVRPGSLLVVVGAGDPARRLGAALADEMGIDPARIPLASLDAGAYALATGPLLLRSAEDAAERAPGWRRSEAAVVVVDAGVTNRERSWAAHLIAALRPTAVWGVVDSTSKTEDIAAWAAALGGLDALALENTDATVSPAAALGAGIAVARINGHPATAARWAATIIDRVQPCP